MTIGPRCLKLLKEAHALQASDLLIVAGSAPSVYVAARLRSLGGGVLSSDEAASLILEMMDERQRARLEQERDADFSIASPEIGRCRVNVHYQRDSLAAAIRFVRDAVPNFEDLGLPEVVADFARLPRGLVLITGGTGSGKSTTMAAMIQEINKTTAAHIITLEDPIEYAFQNRQCVIEQREIGSDSPGFVNALRHIVRQKPDIIMIGEMRDLETIRTAVTAAETGHLVLASLHTISAAQTVERMVDVFEPAQQPQIRIQLAGALRAIVCQSLLPAADGESVVVAVEVLVNHPAIARAIRDGETHLIHGMVETGANRGMQTLDQTLAKLVQSGRVTREEALRKAADADRLERTLGQSCEPVLAGGKRPTRPWE
jgi:twitching motility protein PilT